MMSVNDAMNRFPLGPEYYGFFDDFLNRNTVATTGEWVFTAAGSGTLTLLSTEAGGAVEISGDGSTDNSGGNLGRVSEFIYIEQNKPVLLFSRFKVTDVDDQDIMFGAFVTDTAMVGGVTDGIYVSLLEADGDGLVNCVLERDSSATTEAGVHTAADATWVIVGIAIYPKTSTTGDIVFYFDGEEKHKMTDVTLPVGSEEPLRVAFESLSGTTTADKLTIDYVGAICKR